MKNDTRRFDAGILLGVIGVLILMFCSAGCVCVVSWWNRLTNGACPMKGCDGWKVTCHERHDDGGTYTTKCCSNAPWCDEGSGCEWYETVFVSNLQREIEMRVYMNEMERRLMAGSL